MIVLLIISLILLVVGSILFALSGSSNENYKAYINSLKDDVSRKRLETSLIQLKKYGLKKPDINEALHYKQDRKKIEKKYPTIDKSLLEKRPGAYGLMASFIQFLENNSDTTENVWWFEDDAFPCGTKQEFRKQLDKAMKKMPVEGNDVYSFGRTDYCRKTCKNKEKWKKQDTYIPGCHALIFTPESIKSILNYIRSNKVNDPLDHFIYHRLPQNNVINAWVWEGNLCKEHPMFCGLFRQYDTDCKYRKNNTMLEKNK